ncbi:MAG: HAMP domain-containing histidine kinase, partial [Anaerolineales bacterium]
MATNGTHMQELTAALEREQKARQQAEVELARVKKGQQEFISLVSHELRIPMTAIQGYTDLLIKAIMGPVNETQLTFLQTIRSNVERMSRLVADLSDINKISGGTLQVKPKVVMLKPLIYDLVKDFQPAISLKKLTLNTDITESLPPLWCDDDRLRQVLVNLLRNATQYI